MLWLEAAAGLLVWCAREGWYLRLLESHTIIILLATKPTSSDTGTTHALALIKTAAHTVITEALTEGVGLESLLLLLLLLILHTSKWLLLLPKSTSTHRLLLLAHILHAKGIAAHLIATTHLIIIIHLEIWQTSNHWLEWLLLLLLLLLWLSLSKSSH